MVRTCYPQKILAEGVVPGGNLLTFALYNKVYTEKTLSIEDYKDILRAGGSERPRDLLAGYGIDIASPEFYRAGIAEVERMVEEFEGLS